MSGKKVGQLNKAGTKFRDLILASLLIAMISSGEGKKGLVVL